VGCCTSCCGSKAAGKEVGEAIKNNASKVKVHVGPLEMGVDGVVAKPKFNIGVKGGGLYFMAGVRDVRDGLAAESFAMMMKSYSTEGESLKELLENVQAEEKVPALDDLVKAVPDILAAVMSELSIDLASKKMEMEGVVYVYAGAGVSAGVWLGWLDTDGYAMVGAEGRVAALATAGASLRVGKHADGKSARVVAYLTNVGFDVVVKLKDGDLQKV